MDYNNMKLDKIVSGLDARNRARSSALYAVYWINEKLEAKGKKIIVLTQSSCYTYHLATKVVDLDSTETSWCYYSSKEYHKTWSDCNNWLEGFRDCLDMQ